MMIVTNAVMIVCVCVTPSFLTPYLMIGSMDIFHSSYVDASFWEDELYSFFVESKVICGHQTSKTEISQVRKHCCYSYLACGWVIVSRWSVLLLVEVKGHLRSPESKTEKPCKHFISKQKAWIHFILIMWMHHIEKKAIVFVEVKGHLRSLVVNIQNICNYVVFGGGQRSPEVNY